MDEKLFEKIGNCIFDMKNLLGYLRILVSGVVEEGQVRYDAHWVN